MSDCLAPNLSRRACLKVSLASAGRLLIPTGAVALVGCQSKAGAIDPTGFSGSIMGTGYTVRLGEDAIDGTAVSVNDLAQRVRVALVNVDSLMSTWRAGSEVSQFNARTNDEWVVMKPATALVMQQALLVSEQSNGAFDVTVAPLIDLWGFGAGSHTSKGKIPLRKQIAQQMAQVGYQAIERDADTGAFRKRNPLAQVDLSGIAKGFAVDRVSEVLDAAGVSSYLVEIGGELKSRGNRGEDIPWKVAIERPSSTQQRDAIRIVALEDAAIATSGDYRHFFMNAGQRYSHSIDPRSGLPVNHGLASVTVVASDTMNADALSTALMILGPDDAMSFAQGHGLAAHFVLRSGGAMQEVYSAKFESLLT